VEPVSTPRAQIVAEGLTVRLDDVTVLEEVSFEIEAGSFVTIVGANGAGKTTLLRCIDGLVRPGAGRLLIEGRPAGARSRRELARLVSYVPQSEAPGADYDVRSYVAMGRYPHLRAWTGLGPADEQIVDEALEMTGTAHLADRSLVRLSGGEHQRVRIAAALAQGGSILLLDEPTSFLDYRHQVRILDLIARLHQERRLTIVAVSHDLNGPISASDAVLALRAGRVVAQGTPEAILEREVLERIFDTRFDLVPRPSHGLPIVVPTRPPGDLS
jgi:iron complex transport system ATP-binding protein